LPGQRSLEPSAVQRAVPEAKLLVFTPAWTRNGVGSAKASRQTVGDLNEKGIAAPIYATVLAFATRNSKDQSVCQTFTFDRELGWHFLETNEKAARIWNKDGYSEVKPWGTWIRTVPK